MQIFELLKNQMNSKKAVPVLLLVVLLIMPRYSNSTSIIEYLPGYPGKLPFKLETGYIGVGEEEQVQLFYYFFESEGDPGRDPVLLWHNGGPGCSAFSGITLENGPLKFSNSNESWQLEVPKLELNPYSWTKAASIIYLDWPVGTGFSYSITQEGYRSDDTLASKHNFLFLNKWLKDHVKFQKNSVYMAGDSYAGMVVPMVVKETLNGNADGIEPLINLKGYILGNPVTMRGNYELSSQYKFARRVSLLSDELYESADDHCNGNYENVEVGNITCNKDLQAINYNLKPLFGGHVLEPKCNVSFSHTPCREDRYLNLGIWANNKHVQQALHIREGTKDFWVRCNQSLAYERSNKNSVDYHQSLTEASIHALVYSGDQDMNVSYVNTLDWIRKLNVSIINDWSPWFVKAQVAGYTMKYSNGHYHLTYATVKGAGHTAPEYKPLQCLHLIMNWLKK